MSHQTKHIMPLSFSLLIAGTNGAQAVNPQSQEQDAQPPPSAGRRQGQGPAAQRGGVTLQTADDKEIDVQLEVGATTESVEVSSGTPLIDTTSATSGTVITSEELNELPTSSHVVTLFATLSPGLVAQYQNNNVAHLWSFNAASQFEANGGRNNIYSIS